MIVRILTEDQYRIPDNRQNDISDLDSRLLSAIEQSNHKEFSKALSELNTLIHATGVVVPGKEIVKSDMVVPSLDMTLENARQILAHQG